VPDLFPRTKLTLAMPDGALREPRLWVERFCLYADGDKPFREITLKPGLNIIWSPDARNEQDSIGHGAGKTTFCRLLRFCLGEKSFGSDVQEERIKSSFPTGKVGVELHLDGERWAIVRHFRRYSRDTILRGGTLEQAFSGEHDTETMATFISAVQDTFFVGVHELFPKKVNPEEVWGAALAWLSRDQECRFDGALDWRHAHTESESPIRNLKLEERSQVARALLGCISSDEADLDDSSGASSPSPAEVEADRLLWGIARIQQRLAAALGSDVALGIGELDLDLLEHTVRDRFPNLPSLQISAVRRARQNAFSTLQRATQRLRELESSLNAHLRTHAATEALLAQKRGVVDHYASSITISENPACRVCAVPLDRIFEEGCPCSTADADIEAVRRRHELAVSEVGALEVQVTSSKKALTALELSVEREKSTEHNAQQAFKDAENAEDQALQSSTDGDRLFNQLESLKSLVHDHQACLSQIAEEGKEKAKRTQRLKILRADSRAVIQRLSARFDDVIRELFPGEVSGAVSLDGAKLELTVGPGERSTAAIDSWKAVAFDLSALTLACEGTAQLPPWLLHDSPREADLGESIYARLFSFVASLEGTVQFQYIVTTTTPPPEDMQKLPHLRATLKGGPPSERLLKCDLGESV
jgi:hypothetical protein